MAVQLLDEGVIGLEGVCGLDDAEILLQRLLEAPPAIVDWRLCEHAHAALIQILMAAKPTLRGPPQGGFLREMVDPQLRGEAR